MEQAKALLGTFERRRRQIEETYIQTDFFQQTNPLFFSSFVFLTNVVTGSGLYSALFLCLTATSIAVHSKYTAFTYVLDKVSIAAVVVYGGSILWKKIEDVDVNWNLVRLSVLSFLVCTYVYCYGYLTGLYCFDPDRKTANKYHALMHYTSSIGHHCVAFL
jgi:hypothetical protein